MESSLLLESSQLPLYGAFQNLRRGFRQLLNGNKQQFDISVTVHAEINCGMI